MGDLESQEEDDPRRILWYKSLVFLGVIRPHHRDESWSAGLCSPFSTCVGTHIPVLSDLPLSTCGCKKSDLDVKTQQVDRNRGQ